MGGGVVIEINRLVYVLFVVLFIVFMSNAFNISDGLDGLAVGNSFVLFSLIGFYAYISSFINADVMILDRFNLLPLSGGLEIAVICASIVGANLVFLWYNTYPASIFLGDTGALMYGAVIGFLIVVSKSEILLIIASLFYVVELFSVIIQVVGFKISKGKRIFKMAPLHHHFELSGVTEPKIVVRTWILNAFAFYSFLYYLAR